MVRPRKDLEIYHDPLKVMETTRKNVPTMPLHDPEVYNRMTSVRVKVSVKEESGIFEIPFLNQGKCTFLEKTREKSGNFIMNQGKNQGITLQYLFVIFQYFSEKLYSRLRRSHTINVS